ncbi:MAG: hypothetical protein P9F75_17750 [Candidatus Contendobacter sp.]|nr:hypothetical protein [Candidatus Contendobacter sp.]
MAVTSPDKVRLEISKRRADKKVFLNRLVVWVVPRKARDFAQASSAIVGKPTRKSTVFDLQHFRSGKHAPTIRHG